MGDPHTLTLVIIPGEHHKPEVGQGTTSTTNGYWRKSHLLAVRIMSIVLITAGIIVSYIYVPYWRWFYHHWAYVVSLFA